MLKRALILLGVVMALALFVINLKHITPAHAEQRTEVKLFLDKKLVKSVVFAVGVNKYYTSEKPEGVSMDAKPFVESGRTFMPVRFLSSALGVEDNNIAWDGASRKVALTQPGFPVVEMTVGKIELRSGGSPVPGVDVAPILKAGEGRTYLPARYVAEALGYEVEWDEVTQTVLCWPKGEVKPDVTVIKQSVQKERDLLAGKAPEGYYVTKKGYVVPEPKNTKLHINGKAEADVDIRLVVYLPSSDYAKARLPKEQWRTEEQRIEQLRQVEEILAQKHGREIAKTVVEYAGQKKMEDVMTLEWRAFPLSGEGKTWFTWGEYSSRSKGSHISVMSSRQANYVTIDVWRV